MGKNVLIAVLIAVIAIGAGAAAFAQSIGQKAEVTAHYRVERTGFIQLAVLPTGERPSESDWQADIAFGDNLLEGTRKFTVSVPQVERGDWPDRVHCAGGIYVSPSITFRFTPTQEADWIEFNVEMTDGRGEVLLDSAEVSDFEVGKPKTHKVLLWSGGIGSGHDGVVCRVSAPQYRTQ